MLFPGMNLKLDLQNAGGDPNADLKVGIAAYWKLDESNYQDATDATGNGHTLTNTNNYSYAAGVINNGGVGTGNPAATAALYRADNTILPVNQMSMQMWINRNGDTQVPNTRGEGGTWHYNTAGAWMVEHNSGAYRDLQFYIPTSAAAFSAGHFTATADNTGWHHYVFVFDGTQTGDANRMKIYEDGINQALSFIGAIPSTLLTSTTEVNLGVWLGLARYSPHALDEVGIWSERALSQSDVNRLFNGGSGLALY